MTGLPLAFSLGNPAARWELSNADADELRKLAEDILSGPAYAQHEPGLLERLFDWLGGLFDFTAPSPGLSGSEIGGFEVLRSVLIVVAILLLVAWGTSFVIRQRSAIKVAERHQPGHKGTSSVGELERLANVAAREGAYGESLRLRFEAGLARLERKGSLRNHETRNSEDVSRTLQLPEFDEVAATFDEVVYGGRTARETDAAFAAHTWPTIVARAPVEDES